MQVAVVNQANSIQGVPKRTFEKSLQRLSEQTRRMDQKLSIKVENEIKQHFDTHNFNIKHAKHSFKKIGELGL